MAYEFKFPDVGEGIAEGEIVAWHKEVGDRVEAHEILLEVETDKAVVEIPSPVSGVVTQRNGEVGDVIEVGAVLVVIDTGGGQAAEPEAPEDQPPETEPPETQPAPSPSVSIPDDIPLPGMGTRPCRAEIPTEPVVRESVGVVGQLEEAPEEEEEQAAVPEQGAQPTRVRVEALPRDRQLAKQLGVEIDALRGTGPGGRVTEEDVRQAADRVSAPLRAQAGGPSLDRDEHGPLERVPVRGVRRKIAEAMVRSLQNSAQVTTTGEADVTRLSEIRTREQGAVEAAGGKLTYLPFLIKAVVGALKRDPYLNSSFDDEAGEIRVKGYYNIGVATETADGLIVPVVKGADRLTVLELAGEIARLSQKARERTLTVDEIKGSTFTLSNYGAIGGIFATPILNYPETGLLGIGRAAQKPVVVDGAIAVRSVMPLSLTFDHRVVDGATAQHFLENVIRRLEDPDLLLLGA